MSTLKEQCEEIRQSYYDFTNGSGARPNWFQVLALLEYIDELKSTPVERLDIADRNTERKQQRLPVTSHPQYIRDIDTLLEDCARYRNAHAVHMAERTALNEKLFRLQSQALVL